MAAQHKTTLKDRAVLLANSHEGEGPARGAGPNLHLLGRGWPAGIGRKKRILFVFSFMRAIGAGGAAGADDVVEAAGAVGACAKIVWCCARGTRLRGDL